MGAGSGTHTGEKDLSPICLSHYRLTFEFTVGLTAGFTIGLTTGLTVGLRLGLTLGLTLLICRARDVARSHASTTRHDMSRNAKRKLATRNSTSRLGTRSGSHPQPPICMLYCRQENLEAGIGPFDAYSHATLSLIHI